MTKKQISKFKSEAAEREFWAKHDLTGRNSQIRFTRGDSAGGVSRANGYQQVQTLYDLEVEKDRLGTRLDSEAQRLAIG